MSLDQAARDREAEPCAARGAGRVPTPEAFEHALACLRVDPLAGVLDRDAHLVVPGLDAHRDRAVRGRVPQCVREQVHQDPLQLLRREAGRDVVVDLGREPDVPRPCFGFHAPQAARDDRCDGQTVKLERQCARVDASELEQVVDEQGERVHLLAEHGHELVRRAESILERFQHRLHVRERRPEIVARPGHELTARVE